MEIGEDLTAAAVAEVMPERPVRAYPALLSTEAESMAWARSDGPAGGLVVADYQASPRGRAGLEWETRPGRDLGFSLILRPQLPAAREGWVYAVAICGLADTLAAETTIAWPDEARRSGVRVGAVGVQTQMGPEGLQWAVVNVLVPDAEPPRAPLLTRVVQAIEAREQAEPPTVRADYVARCETIGRPVRALLIPMGPGGPQVEGTARNLLTDGSLSIRTVKGKGFAVRPQNLGKLEELEELEETAEPEAADSEAAAPGGEGEHAEGEPKTTEAGDGQPRGDHSGNGRRGNTK